MKIAHIGPRFIPIREDGGLENALKSIAYHQARMGHQATVYCAEGSEIPGVETIALAPARLHRNETEYIQMVNAQAQAAFIEINARNYDIIHDHTGAFAPLAGQVNMPVVVTFHNGVEQALIFSQGATTNVTYVTVSDSLRKEFEETRLRVPYHIYPDVDCQYLLQIEATLENRERKLVALSNLKPNKGVDLAIQVALRLGYKLEFAGYPPEEQYQEWYNNAVHRFVDDEQIKYLGIVGNEGKKQLFKNASAFLMLNRSYSNPYMEKWREPFGIVTVEAMAAGVPVVGVEGGATAELVGDAGVILPSVSDIETVLGAVLRVPYLNMVSPEICRARARAFSPGTAARQYLDIYQSLLDG